TSLRQAHSLCAEGIQRRDRTNLATMTAAAPWQPHKARSSLGFAAMHPSALRQLFPAERLRALVEGGSSRAREGLLEHWDFPQDRTHRNAGRRAPPAEGSSSQAHEVLPKRRDFPQDRTHPNADRQAPPAEGSSSQAHAVLPNRRPFPPVPPPPTSHPHSPP